MKKKILLGLLIILVGMQLFRIDKTSPEVIIENDFITITNPSDEVASILKSSCYDCHSNETKYPWYSNVAPVSWWVKDHIDEARDELNFSEWGTFKFKRKDHKLEEMVEMLEEGEMPLDEYTWTHAEASLTDEQKMWLIDWVKEIREDIKPKKNELRLNDGEKWKVDVYTRTAIDSMTTIVTEEIEEGRISLYIAMAQRLYIQSSAEAERWPGDDDITKQFFYFMEPLSEKILALENVSTEDEAMILQKDILKDLNNYHNYFE